MHLRFEPATLSRFFGVRLRAGDKPLRHRARRLRHSGGGDRVTPVPAFAAHPDVWLVLGGVAAIYLYAVIRVGPSDGREGDQEPPRPDRSARSSPELVSSGWSSDWPVHDIAEQSLYSVHMAQHMAITLVAPPLLLAGTPRWLAEVLHPKARAAVCPCHMRPDPGAAHLDRRSRLHPLAGGGHPGGDLGTRPTSRCIPWRWPARS